VHAFNAEHHPVPIESRSLGDSPAIALLVEPWCGVFRAGPRVRFAGDGGYVPSGAPVDLRVCVAVDVRFLLEDMFAKIRAHAGAGSPTG
jgi:hypothetical protein